MPSFNIAKMEGYKVPLNPDQLAEALGKREEPLACRILGDENSTWPSIRWPDFRLLFSTGGMRHQDLDRPDALSKSHPVDELREMLSKKMGMSTSEAAIIAAHMNHAFLPVYPKHELPSLFPPAPPASMQTHYVVNGNFIPRLRGFWLTPDISVESWNICAARVPHVQRAIERVVRDATLGVPFKVRDSDDTYAPFQHMRWSDRSYQSSREFDEMMTRWGNHITESTDPIKLRQVYEYLILKSWREHSPNKENFTIDARLEELDKILRNQIKEILDVHMTPEIHECLTSLFVASKRKPTFIEPIWDGPLRLSLNLTVRTGETSARSDNVQLTDTDSELSTQSTMKEILKATYDKACKLRERYELKG